VLTSARKQRGVGKRGRVRLADTVVTGFRLRAKKITMRRQHQRHFSNEDLQTETATPIWRRRLDGVEGVDIRQGTGKTAVLDISIRACPANTRLF